jgi:hypothetical protein
VSDPQGTVTWWDLGDAVAGSPVFGWGPYQNHGALVGGVSPVAGGLAFDGSTGYVSVPHHASLELGTSPTPNASSWAVWCRIARGPTGAVRALVSKGGGSYRLQLDATGRPQIVDGGVVTATATAIIDANPHVIFAGRAGSSTYIFVDGASQAVASASGGTASSGLPLTIGAHMAAAGTPQDFFNGTMFAAGYLPSFLANSLQGPVILVKIPAGATIDVPAILTTWRDPVDASNVSARLAVLFGAGVRPFVSATYAVPNNIAGGSSGSVSVDATGHAAITLPVAAAMNGRLLTPMTLTATGGGFSTTWDNAVRAQWALTRLAPNVALGDHVSELAADPQLVQPATHAAAAFMRAATGPNAGDYMAGSSWALVPPATLPATAAYLAVQLQLVRRA